MTGNETGSCRSFAPRFNVIFFAARVFQFSFVTFLSRRFPSPPTPPLPPLRQPTFTKFCLIRSSDCSLPRLHGETSNTALFSGGKLLLMILAVICRVAKQRNNETTFGFLAFASLSRLISIDPRLTASLTRDMHYPRAVLFRRETHVSVNNNREREQPKSRRARHSVRDTHTRSFALKHKRGPGLIACIKRMHTITDLRHVQNQVRLLFECQFVTSSTIDSYRCGTPANVSRPIGTSFVSIRSARSSSDSRILSSCRFIFDSKTPRVQTGRIYNQDRVCNSPLFFIDLQPFRHSGILTLDRPVHLPAI